MGELEVEVEFKEEEQVVLSVLEVEVEFKEEEKDEQVIWWVLEVEEEEEEEQVIWWSWRPRWSSRRKNRSF